MSGRLGILMSMCVVLFVLSIAVPSYAQQPASALKISMEPMNWTEEMKSLGITTRDRGLILKVTVMNSHQTHAVTLNSFQITAAIEYEEKQTKDYQYITETTLYIPPGQNFTRFIKINLGYPPNDIGRWSVKANYQFGGYNWETISGQRYFDQTQNVITSAPIEPYPFQFKVVGDEQFNQEIKNASTNVSQSSQWSLITIQNLVIEVIPISAPSVIIGAGAAALLVRKFYKNRKKANAEGQTDPTE